MGGKEVNGPMAVGIVATVVILVLVAGYMFIGRKPATSPAEESKRKQFQQMSHSTH